ncbi:hypothetical protein ABRG53_3509 [Pseudanabaena sp. ABRG5-3]|nr:hypothetical protein ABRG53_3509 [Pseudanabaena sp. ABRG5-3]
MVFSSPRCLCVSRGMQMDAKKFEQASKTEQAKLNVVELKLCDTAQDHH